MTNDGYKFGYNPFAINTEDYDHFEKRRKEVGGEKPKSQVKDEKRYEGSTEKYEAYQIEYQKENERKRKYEKKRPDRKEYKKAYQKEYYKKNGGKK